MGFQQRQLPTNSHFGQRFGKFVMPNSATGYTQTMPHAYAEHPMGMYRPGSLLDNVGGTNMDTFVAPDGVTPVINGFRDMVTPPAVAVGDRIYISEPWHRLDIYRGGNFIGAPVAAVTGDPILPDSPAFQGWTGAGGIYAEWLDYTNLNSGQPVLQTIMIGNPASLTAGVDAELIEPGALGLPGQPTQEDIYIYYLVTTAPQPGDTFKVVFNLKDGGE